MTALVEVRGLAAGYAGRPVIRGLDCDLPAGAITAVIGPNGHGKTTLLRALSGLLPGTTGAVRLDGALLPEDAALRVAAGIVHVPQGDQLFTGLTVDENLRLGGYRLGRGVALQPGLDRVYSLFPRLAERRQQRAEGLSGGERRMVGIGRGMMAVGRIMLIDEPSLGLAPIIIDQIYAALAALAADGGSFLIVEENPVRLGGIAGEVWLMDNGRIAWRGSAAELDARGGLLSAMAGH
jgi:branched-chain amino acid transport system ATP-binding protein